MVLAIFAMFEACLGSAESMSELVSTKVAMVADDVWCPRVPFRILTGDFYAVVNELASP